MVVRYAGRVVAFDGGPGAEPPSRLDAWLVCDEQAELASDIRRMAGERGVEPGARSVELGDLRVHRHPVVHTSHPTFGYRITAAGAVVVWAPEFWEFPAWSAQADLMFAEASGWNRPIRFRGGVGGHASVLMVGEEARRHGVRRLVYAHIGRPCIKAMDAGLEPPFGEWGREGRTYVLTVDGRRSSTRFS
jgi:hypothetical protein